MIFGLLYFCVVILCVNRSNSSFILYKKVKRHSRQSNVRRIWTCADNEKARLYLYYVVTRVTNNKKSAEIEMKYSTANKKVQARSTFYSDNSHIYFKTHLY